FVFVLASALAFFTPGYEWLTLLAAPVAFYWISLRCLRKKAPHFGSEGLKAGAIWVLVFVFLDFVVMPLWRTPYDAFLSARFNYVIYLGLLAVPWAADKIMSGLRKI
ncbi:MAG: hypothetical protein QXD77_01100, partial [Candidatus Aenigmatarchaeota archaeon]